MSPTVTTNLYDFIKFNFNQVSHQAKYSKDSITQFHFHSSREDSDLYELGNVDEFETYPEESYSQSTRITGHKAHDST